VREINAFLHHHQIEVSGGGLLETVVPFGKDTILRYIDESAAPGFDIIEISSALVSISPVFVGRARSDGVLILIPC
jgi:phosphosulfolactate synthase (CoM biosynthesis protein A)